jgi:diguanylate cyclase (GGDEF)-like protein
MDDAALDVHPRSGAPVSEIEQAERLFHRLAQALPLGLFLVRPDRTVGYGNARLARILGVQAATTLDEQLATVDPVDRAALEAAVAATLAGGPDRWIELGLSLSDTGNRVSGVHRRCRFAMACLSVEEGAIITVTDVTETARLEEELALRASFDELTGCHNRTFTLAALKKALEIGDPTLAVIFVDLDRFTSVNEQMGHAAGDEILMHTAEVLFEQVRSEDRVGRLGGDEFLLLCLGVTSDAMAMEIGMRIQAALRHDVTLAAGRVHLRASVGIARIESGLSADALVARARTAMTDCKRTNSSIPVLHGTTVI